MEKYYFDTSIWIDFYDQRGRNGERAKRLLQKIILEDNTIVYSDLVLKELKNVGFFDYEIQDMLKICKPNHIKHIHITKQQVVEAKKVSHQRQVPFGDALHAILTRDHEAQLVSRDKDFEKLKDITQAKIPEHLL